MPRTPRLLAAASVAAALALSATSALAENYQIDTLVGGQFLDGSEDGSPGVTPFIFFEQTNASQVINSVESVTLSGLTHSAAGDLIVALRWQPLDTTQPFIDVNLFTMVNDPEFFLSNNLEGTYTFRDTATLTLQDAAGADDTDALIPPGTYRAADYYDAGEPAALLSLTNAFAGLNLEDGTFLLVVGDYAAGDTGDLLQATLSLDVTSVPEPTSLAALGVAGAMLTRRRK